MLIRKSKSKILVNFQALHFRNCKVDWDLWLYGKKMPTYKPKFDNTDVKPCLDLAEKWQNWKPSTSPSPTTKEFKALKTLQKMVHLSTLLEGKLLSNETLTHMDIGKP